MLGPLAGGRRASGGHQVIGRRVSIWALVFVAGLATTGRANTAEPELDLRWRGVALSDLPSAETALLARAIAETNPAELTAVTSVAWLERGTRLESVAGWSSASQLMVHHLIQVVGRHPRFASEEDPGTRKEPALGVVVLEARLPRDRSDWPELRVLREAPIASLDLEIAVSLTDRLTVVSDERFGFVRVYPSGVGAIDTVRRPGYVSSLTPATELGRVSRDARQATLSASSWNRGKPYLPFEIPFIAGRAREPSSATRRWYMQTRVAFHIWQGRHFSRGFNSHGCVTLRDDDLDELARFVFANAEPLPLVVRAPDFAQHRHPFPHETGHHWALENLGTARRPVITRGNFYAIDKRDGPPPPLAEMVGIFMDGERRKDPLGPVAAYPDAPPPSLAP